MVRIFDNDIDSILGAFIASFYFLLGLAAEYIILQIQDLTAFYAANGALILFCVVVLVYTGLKIKTRRV